MSVMLRFVLFLKRFVVYSVIFTQIYTPSVLAGILEFELKIDKEKNRLHLLKTTNLLLDIITKMALRGNIRLDYNLIQKKKKKS